MSHFTLIKVTNTSGFAMDTDSREEFFIPKHVIINAGITEDDVGQSFTASTSANKGSDPAALDLIALPVEWDDEVDELAELEDAIERAQALLADLRLAAEAG